MDKREIRLFFGESTRNKVFYSIIIRLCFLHCIWIARYNFERVKILSKVGEQKMSELTLVTV